MPKQENKKPKSEHEVPLYLFHEGSNARAYEYFGAHKSAAGVTFRVWAPHAASVSVVGDFNEWNENTAVMHYVPDSDGVW